MSGFGGYILAERFFKRLSKGIPFILPFTSCDTGLDIAIDSAVCCGEKLIVYFSHSGNTKVIMGQVQFLTGADWFEPDGMVS